MPKLRTLASLSGPERSASLEAAIWLVVMRVLVAALPPRLWRGVLFADGPRQTSLDAAQLAAARIVRHAIARGARNLPGSAKCLPRALAARRMLARRGVMTSLHLGVAPGKGSPSFHAWLKAGDLFVTGDCDEAAYTRFPPAAFPCRQPGSLASHHTK